MLLPLLCPPSLCSVLLGVAKYAKKRKRQCKKILRKHLQKHFSSQEHFPPTLSARKIHYHPYKINNIWVVDWVFLSPFDYEALCTTSSLLGHARNVVPSFGSLIKVTKTSRGSHPCKHKEPFQEMALPLVLTDVTVVGVESVVFKFSICLAGVLSLDGSWTASHTRLFQRSHHFIWLVCPDPPRVIVLWIANNP